MLILCSLFQKLCFDRLFQILYCSFPSNICKINLMLLAGRALWEGAGEIKLRVKMFIVESWGRKREEAGVDIRISQNMIQTWQNFEQLNCELQSKDYSLRRSTLEGWPGSWPITLLHYCSAALKDHNLDSQVNMDPDEVNWQLGVVN